MKCPHCNSENHSVIDSLRGGSNTNYRRRKCKDCGGAFRTVEIVDNGSPNIAKGYSAAMKRKANRYAQSKKERSSDNEKYTYKKQL